jgi:surfeit locus 1 family protein
MARALGTEPVLVIARAPTDPQVLALPVSAEAIPNDHLGYAATWFLLAASWVVMTGYALWRIRRRAAAGDGETAQRARVRQDVDSRDEGRGEGR